MCCTYKLTMRCVREAIVTVESSITHSEFLSVALDIQQAKHMRHTVLSTAAFPATLYFSTLYHKRHDLRKKKTLLNIKCVF